MTDYTPGPWEVLAEYDGDTGIVSAEVLAPSGGNIAYVNDPSLVDDDVMLASAPRLKKERDDLLEAVKSLLSAYERTFDWTCDLPPETIKAEETANELIERIDRG
jgi:hypothetical protein